MDHLVHNVRMMLRIVLSVLLLLRAQSVLQDFSWQLTDHLVHNVRMMFRIVLSVLLLLHAQSVIMDIT